MNSFNQSQSVFIQPLGRLDFQGSSHLLQQLNAIDAMQHQWWVLDLSRIEFIDNCGVSMLVTAMKLARRNGCELIIYNPHPASRLILEITQLDRLLPIYHTKLDLLSGDRFSPELLSYGEAAKLHGTKLDPHKSELAKAELAKAELPQAVAA
jgi:anti-anti-sigma factor